MSPLQTQYIGAVLTFKRAYRVGKVALQRMTVLPSGYRIDAWPGVRYAVNNSAMARLSESARYARPIRCDMS